MKAARASRAELRRGFRQLMRCALAEPPVGVPPYGLEETWKLMHK